MADTKLWNGVDIEERFNLFLSCVLQDANIVVDEEVSMDLALEQDYADILNRIEAHLDMAVKLSNELP
jgi:hypothetical protein